MKNEGMKEESSIEVHSGPVREIMAQIPGWIVRWGLSLIFGIFIIIVFGSYFFRYPESISAPVIITTVNPPAELICRVAGKIHKLYVYDGQAVNTGDLIAVIENTADFDNYLLLKKEMENIAIATNWEETVLAHENKLMLSLGDIQGSFELFKKHWNSFRNYLLSDFIDQKIQLLERQIEIQMEYINILEQQKALQYEDYHLTKNRIARDSIIYVKGGISEKEYESGKQMLLQKENSLKSYDISLNGTKSTILSLKQNVLELNMQRNNDIKQHIMLLDESKQTLEITVRKWEDLYTIVSPVDGRVTLSKFWSENQVVNTGERLATVVPTDAVRIIARSIIPAAGFGKVESGQKVNIRLSGFPYMEFGMLTGYISSVSLVPENEGYIAEIELPRGMLSNYSVDLRFIHGMNGTADIITNETRMISRFVNPIKYMLK